MTSAVPFVMALWALMCAWAACRLGEPLRGPMLRREWQLLMFTALLPLAILDEMLAKPRFDAACAERAAFTQYAPAGAAAAWPAPASPPEKLAGLGLPVQVQRLAWHDRATGKPVASLVYLEAGGGKLARLLGRPGAPLTFKGTCHPRGWSEMASRLGAPAVASPGAP